MRQVTRTESGLRLCDGLEYGHMGNSPRRPVTGSDSTLVLGRATYSGNEKLRPIGSD
jgi:hypothetical protein